MLGPASSRLQSAGKLSLPKQNNWPTTTRGANSWSTWSKWTNVSKIWPTRGGAPGANGQTCQTFGQPEGQSAGAPGANGQTCQTFGQPEGQAAGAPGASGQTSQTFDQPKGQTASQTPGCGCQTVRKTEKKVYITVQGKCYHMDPECQHIRNRNAVVEKVPCSVCVCANMQCLPNFELDAKLPKSSQTKAGTS